MNAFYRIIRMGVAGHARGNRTCKSMNKQTVTCDLNIQINFNFSLILFLKTTIFIKFYVLDRWLKFYPFSEISRTSMPFNSCWDWTRPGGGDANCPVTS